MFAKWAKELKLVTPLSLPQWEIMLRCEVHIYLYVQANL